MRTVNRSLLRQLNELFKELVNLGFVPSDKDSLSKGVKAGPPCPSGHLTVFPDGNWHLPLSGDKPVDAVDDDPACGEV